MKREWNDRLKEKREENGLTLKEITDKLLTTQPTLISYEQGRVYPKIDILVKLCDLYNTSVNYILYGNENGLTLENTEQKIISGLIGLYLNNNLLFDKENNAFQIKDKKMNNLLRHTIEFIEENDKNDIDTIAKVITGINKM